MPKIPNLFAEVVRSSDLPLALVEMDTGDRLAVSQPYAAMLGRDQDEYENEPGQANQSRWAPGELERFKTDLESQEHLVDYSYQAYFGDRPESLSTWTVDAQLVIVEGKKARLMRIHSISRAPVNQET